MDLLKDDLKKLYFRFLIPSLGSAMVISGILWIGYGVGMPALLRVMGGNDKLYPYAMAGVLLGGAANIVLLFNIQILKYCGDAALSRCSAFGIQRYFQLRDPVQFSVYRSGAVRTAHPCHKLRRRKMGQNSKGAKNVLFDNCGYGT